MPGRDGTGPIGIRRSMGNQMGICKRNVPDICEPKYGFGCHLHSRLRNGSCRFDGMNRRDTLEAEKKILENRIRLISEKLNSEKTDNPANQTNS